ncbi:MAG: hypothetical protein NVS1B4_23750 [Gemmatimonadaceae bacterium]
MAARGVDRERVGHALIPSHKAAINPSLEGKRPPRVRRDPSPPKECTTVSGVEDREKVTLRPVASKVPALKGHTEIMSQHWTLADGEDPGLGQERVRGDADTISRAPHVRILHGAQRVVDKKKAVISGGHR